MTRPELNEANQVRVKEARERLELALSKNTMEEAIAVYNDKSSLYRAARNYGRTKDMQEKFGTRTRNKAQRDEVLIEDASFLARHGEHPANAAKRLGYGKVPALERALERANRPDIMARLWANDRMNSKGDSA